MPTVRALLCRVRILYVTFRESLSGGASVGVIETQVRDLLARIARSETVRWLVLSGREARSTPLTALPDWVFEVDIEGAPWLPPRMKGIRTIRSAIRSFRPDVIHARSYNATLLALLATRGRPPVIFDARSLMPLERVGYGNESPSSLRTRTWLAVENRMVRSAGATVAVSPPMADYFRSRSPGRIIETIPLAVDVERMHSARPEGAQLRRELNLEGDDVLLVYAGSLAPAGHGALARVIHRVHRGTPGARTVCLSRDDPRLLLAALEELGSAQIEVVTAAYEDMPKWLAASDWGLVIRSRRNPSLLNAVELTTKFPEYLASGLPVIVNKASGWLSRLTDEKGLGMTIGEDDTAPIALRRWTDEERERLRRIASADYNLDAVAASYISLYRRLSSSTEHRSLRDN